MNSRLKRWLGFLALVAVLIGFGSLILGPSGSQTNRSYVLADGSVLSLGPVSYGTNRTVRLNALTGWHKHLTDLMPYSWCLQLGLLPPGPMIALGGDPGQTNYLVSTICQFGTNTALVSPRVEIFDEVGNVFDGIEIQGSVGTMGGTHSTRMNVWVLAAFPRRGSKLGLRVLAESNQVRQAIAEFRIPNPVRGKYPIWQADSLPIIRQAGDLTVTLMEFSSVPTKRDGTPGSTKLDFELREAGLPAANSWEIAGVKVSDATGNHWQPQFLFRAVTEAGRAKLEWGGGALWPGESAWKVRTELSRTANYAPEESVTWTGIPVPETKGMIALNLTTNVAGGQIKLLYLTGGGQEQPGGLKWSGFRDRINLSVRADLPVEPIRRLRLVGITDEGGLAVKDLRRNGDANGLQATYGFTPHESARFLTITFAVPASRIVEFLARPDFPKP